MDSEKQLYKSERWTAGSIVTETWTSRIEQQQNVTYNRHTHQSESVGQANEKGLLTVKRQLESPDARENQNIATL